MSFKIVFYIYIYTFPSYQKITALAIWPYCNFDNISINPSAVISIHTTSGRNKNVNAEYKCIHFAVLEVI